MPLRHRLEFSESLYLYRSKQSGGGKMDVWITQRSVNGVNGVNGGNYPSQTRQGKLRYWSMTGFSVIIQSTIQLRPNPTSTLGGMVENRDEHREPVIRAFVALPVETLVEVTVRCLPGSGLCVF